MDRLTGWVVRRATWVVLAVLALSGWMSTGLSFHETRPVLDGELPASDPLVHDRDLFTAAHPDRNYYAIGVEAPGPEGIWNHATLAKIVALSRDAAELSGALPDVQSLATWDQVVATDDTVDVRTLMPEAPPDEAALAALRKVVSNDPLLVGRLVSRDGRMALVRVTFAGDAERAVVHAGLEGLRRRYEGPERIAIYGVDHLDQEIDLAMNAHLSILLPMAVGLLLLFFWLSFGRLQAVWITASLIALVVNDFQGVIGLMEIPRSVLSSVIPILLVVVLGSYAVHLLMRTYEEAESRPWRDAVERALRHTCRPVAVAALTTSVGFATLSTFEILSVREFGILAALGVLLGGVLALTWVPAVLVLAGRPRDPRLAGRRWFLRLVSGISDRLAAVALGGSRLALSMAGLLAAVALLCTAAVRVGSNPPEFFPEGHPVREGFESLLRHFHADGFFFLQVSAPRGSDVLEPAFLHRVEALQRDLRALPGVGFASSVSDTVVARMNRTMNGDDPAFEIVPESRALIAQYLELYRWDAADTLAEMIENADSPRHLIIDVFANVNDSATIVDLIDGTRRALARHFPTPAEGSAIFGGDSVVWSAQNRYIVRGKLTSLAGAILLVALACRLVLGGWRLALLAIVPTVSGAIAVFGAMGAVGIRLDLASCVITSIVVGIGVDFALHYLFRFREIAADAPEWTPIEVAAEAVRRSAPPICYDVVSNVVAFGVFVASPLLPIQHFGWLVCISMAACGSATLLLLPRWAAGLGTKASSQVVAVANAPAATAALAPKG